MKKAVEFVPRMAIFLAGVAAGAVVLSRKGRTEASAAKMEELKASLAELAGRVAAHEASAAERLGQVESRLQEHSAKLAETPTTTEIVTAMERLLSKTMASLDERLSTQAHSIDVLKTTVSQTDSLLERVLESLDALQSLNDASEAGHDALLRRPA
jgi:uncharacterized coiled-coil protein SlyX